MDLRDNQLDELIAYTLDMESTVTPAQKRLAWEKLQSRASQQVILAPYGIAPEPCRRERTGLQWGLLKLLANIRSFLMDETRFHRAAETREALYTLKLNRTFMGSEQAMMSFFPTAYIHLSMA